MTEAHHLKYMSKNYIYDNTEQNAEHRIKKYKCNIFIFVYMNCT